MCWACPAIAYRIRLHAPWAARALAVFAAALGLSAQAARAGEGLYLGWNGCPSGSGVSGVTSACDTNDGEQRLYCSFTLAQPWDEVLGIETVVDLQSAAVTLPDWWNLEPANPVLGTPAGCRYGSLSASQDFTGEPGCADFWRNQGAAVIQGYSPGEPRQGAAQARIKAVGILPSSATASLDATQMYYALKIVFDHARTFGPGSCGGCPARACLVLNAIWLRRTPGAVGGDRLLESPGASGGANRALWQGASSLDCDAVPARRTTWGQLKSLYR